MPLPGHTLRISAQVPAHTCSHCCATPRPSRASAPSRPPSPAPPRPAPSQSPRPPSSPDVVVGEVQLHRVDWDLGPFGARDSHQLYFRPVGLRPRLRAHDVTGRRTRPPPPAPHTTATTTATTT
ncbi:hypothetical protein E2C01_007490 [Portunus trituberculatus]|uniref:Uncharacterized protein n=1 Tax=Portunus trituberculatus TaxID=210409 RepID=A0A5B7CZD5_PORTR|nr:hypothetical protein [Portunus trituberculatus]